MSTCESVKKILNELDGILCQVDEAQIDAFCDSLLKARRVIGFALGREGLALRSFIMRLFHLGIQVSLVGDVNAPPIGPGDVLLVICGPGYLGTTESLMGIARKAGARLVLVTAEPQKALAKMADVVLYIPAQTMARAEGAASGQAMGSAFEQACWILFDALVPRLREARGETLDTMRARHANLE